MFVLRSGASSAALRDYVAGNDSPYFDIEADPYTEYLGYVAVGAPGAVRAQLKASSYLLRLLAPERSAGGSFRRYPWTGFLAREQVYSSAGTKQQADYALCMRRTFRDHFGEQWPDLIAEGASGESLQVSSWDDRLALTNPDTLHYLLDSTALSPAVADRLTVTIPSTFFAERYRHLSRKGEKR